MRCWCTAFRQLAGTKGGADLNIRGMAAVHADVRVPYSRYDKPLAFYVLATAVPWALWLAGAWFSHRDQDVAATLLALAGLFAPLAVAALISMAFGYSAEQFL